MSGCWYECKRLWGWLRWSMLITDAWVVRMTKWLNLCIWLSSGFLCSILLAHHLISFFDDTSSSQFGDAFISTKSRFWWKSGSTLESVSFSGHKRLILPISCLFLSLFISTLQFIQSLGRIQKHSMGAYCQKYNKMGRGVYNWVAFD